VPLHDGSIVPPAATVVKRDRQTIRAGEQHPIGVYSASGANEHIALGPMSEAIAEMVQALERTADEVEKQRRAKMKAHGRLLGAGGQ
jgi:hypothetical protein